MLKSGLKTPQQIRNEFKLLKAEKKDFVGRNILPSLDNLDSLKRSIISNLLSDESFNETFKFLYGIEEFRAINTCSTDRLTLERLFEIYLFFTNQNVDSCILEIKKKLTKIILNNSMIASEFLTKEVISSLKNDQLEFLHLDFLVSSISNINLALKVLGKENTCVANIDLLNCSLSKKLRP